MIIYERKIPKDIRRYRIIRKYLKEEFLSEGQSNSEPPSSFHIEVNFGWWIFTDWNPIGPASGFKNSGDAYEWVRDQCYGVIDKYSDEIVWSGAWSGVETR